MMKILITNDDGVQAPGIKALREAVPQEAEALIVAPASERSASSHSISLGQKLRIEESRVDGVRQIAVHGTPADSVKFAISEVQDFKPDLILSGINQGANTGVSVYYSGTISAAREGSINRIPAIAVSLCSKTYRDFIPSIEITAQLIEAFKTKEIDPHMLLNVNVPPLAKGQIKGVKLTKQAASRFIEEFVVEKQHDNRKVYSLAGEIELYEPDGTSDEEAVLEGYISITPLRLDLTDYEVMGKFKSWVE